MSRTPDEIRASIYAACGGDWTDGDDTTADLQDRLISALIWAECVPAGGWCATGNRQIAALRELLQASDPEVAPINLFAPMGETPDQVIGYIAQHLTDKVPWDTVSIDEYIQRRSRGEGR